MLGRELRTDAAVGKAAPAAPGAGADAAGTECEGPGRLLPAAGVGSVPAGASMLGADSSQAGRPAATGTPPDECTMLRRGAGPAARQTMLSKDSGDTLTVLLICVIPALCICSSQLANILLPQRHAICYSYY